jgi:hypothetical protein
MNSISPNVLRLSFLLALLIATLGGCKAQKSIRPQEGGCLYIEWLDFAFCETDLTHDSVSVKRSSDTTVVLISSGTDRYTYLEYDQGQLMTIGELVKSIQTKKHTVYRESIEDGELHESTLLAYQLLRSGTWVYGLSGDKPTVMIYESKSSQHSVAAPRKVLMHIPR